MKILGAIVDWISSILDNRTIDRFIVTFTQAYWTILEYAFGKSTLYIAYIAPSTRADILAGNHILN